MLSPIAGERTVSQDCIHQIGNPPASNDVNHNRQIITLKRESFAFSVVSSHLKCLGSVSLHAPLYPMGGFALLNRPCGPIVGETHQGGTDG